MQPSTILRALEEQKPEPLPYVYTNPYRAKRLWPPDFDKISHKYQFRLERKYRRRSQLKWARPRWTKAVKLAQFVSITSVIIYGVLFLDRGEAKEPFPNFRKKFFDFTGNLFHPSSQRVQRKDGGMLPVDPVDGGRKL